MGVEGRADALGSYTCSAVNELGKATFLRINVDTNEIWQSAFGNDPQNPGVWKAIYSSQNKQTFCGWPPANSADIKCGFDTKVETDTGFLSKSLLCQKTYANGSSDVITTGDLYLNAKSLDGSLTCSVMNSIGRYQLKFSSCVRD